MLGRRAIHAEQGPIEGYISTCVPLEVRSLDYVDFNRASMIRVAVTGLLDAR